MKKRRCCFWVPCLLWLCFQLGAISLTAQENLLLNPWFDHWTDGRPDHWNFREPAIQEGEQVLRGDYALGQRNWVSYMWQDVPDIVAGGLYEISYWFYDNDPDAGSSLWACWLSGGECLDDDAEILRPDLVSDEFDGWQELLLTLTAPDGADGFRFGVKTHDTGNGGGSVLFDDFSMVRQFIFSGFGHETFNNLGLSGTTYQCGSFIGEDGLEWFYSQCRGNIPIDGPAIMIGPNRNPRSSFHSQALEHGVGTLSFDYMQALTSNVNLQVMVNGEVVGTFTTDGQQDEILHSGPIEVHVPGEAVISFMGVTNSSGHVAIDNIAWTPFDPEQLPAEMLLANLAALRQRSSGHEVVYQVESELVITWPVAEEKLYYVQDATAGVILRDPYGLISSNYGLYDGLENVRGRLNTDDGVLYFDLADDPGAVSSTGNEVEVLRLTAGELVADAEQYQAQLVRLDDVFFVDAAAVFEADSYYRMSDGSIEFSFRAAHASAPYIGEDIPEAAMSLTGIAGATASHTFVTARYASDMLMPLAYAVVFTVADNTESLKHIDLAGDMTGWDLVGLMENPAHNWSVTLNIPPGAYAWNALASDGQGPPFWLMPGEHLHVTVTDEGETTGDHSFVYLVVSSAGVDVSVVKLYPNPAGTKLHIESDEPIYRIQVVNTLGQQVYTVDSGGVENYSLDVGGFAPGLYVVRVLTDSGLAIEKIQVEP